MNYSFKTSGTCATGITFDIDDDKKITNVKFQGGCDGNLKAIGILVNGKSAEEISSALRGNTCGNILRRSAGHRGHRSRRQNRRLTKANLLQCVHPNSMP